MQQSNPPTGRWVQRLLRHDSSHSPEPAVPQEGLKRSGPGAYSNWNGVVVFTPKEFVAPKNIAELQDIVKRSSRLRMVGSGHSMNGAIAADSDTILVQMNNINRLEKPRKEADGGFSVWVEAGATLGNVAAALSLEGLAFSSLPQSPKITLGGMIANGVHGSSFRESALLAEQVTEMELITSSGQLTVVPPELLRLALIGLGSLGAVARVKIRVVPNFDLVSSSEILSADVALETQTLIADLSAHDFQLSYSYDPVAHTVTRRTLDRVEPSQAHRFAGLPRKTQYDQRHLGFIKHHALALVAGLPNGVLGLRNQLKRHIREGFMAIEPRIGESRFMFQTDLNHAAHDMAYGVPIARCREILETIAREFEQIGYQPDLPLGMRFLKGTHKAALAMNSGEDVAVIEWASLIEFNDNTEAFRVFERVLYEAGGRPHWAKEFSFSPKNAYPEDIWNSFAELSARWGWKFANAWSLRFSPAGDAKTAHFRSQRT
jgi:FAD/FMN-containing dehydrogenase